jgi:hypothetical protein
MARNRKKQKRTRRNLKRQVRKQRAGRLEPGPSPPESSVNEQTLSILRPLRVRTMHSTTYFALAAIVTGIAAVSVAVFTVLGYRAKNREGQASNNDAASRQISNTEGIKSHQKSLANDIARRVDNSTQEMMSHQDEASEEVKSLLRALLMKEDDLWRKYPFGYVLLSNQLGKPRQVYPLFNRDEAMPSPVADWKDTEIALDTSAKTFRAIVPRPSWSQAPGLVILGKAISQGKYRLGQPVEMNAVHIEGLPNMYLEVLDDDPSHQVCVIGFRK